MPSSVLETQIRLPTGVVLAAPSTTAILAAFLPDGTVQNMFAFLVAQPSAICCTGIALCLVVTDAGSAITSAQMQVTGEDVHGRALYEVVSTNVPGSNSYPLTKPFYTITAITITGVGFSGAMRLSVGVIGVLGLDVVIVSADDVLVARIDTGVEAAPIISVDNQTWTPLSAPNGARTFITRIRNAA